MSVDAQPRTEAGLGDVVEADLRFKALLLEAQLETTLDGVLVVNAEGRTVLSNRRFAKLWKVPEPLLATRDDEAMLRHAVSLLKSPESFLDKVRHLYEHREESSRDELALKDGRVFDRFSAPLLDANCNYHGRIWFFRDVTGQKLAQAEKDRLIAELQQALGNVQTLSGLLPICASCKKIRDDKGHWNQLEKFLSDRTDADFTHGICPECLKEQMSGTGAAGANG